MPGEMTQRVLIEYLRNQPHGGIYVEVFAVAGSDTGALLPAVLKGKQGKKGKAGYLLIGSIDTKNATAFVQICLPSVGSPEGSITLKAIILSRTLLL
jgi:hypothetical protein